MVPPSSHGFRAHHPVRCHCCPPPMGEPGCPPVCPPASATHAGWKAILLNEATPLKTIPKVKNGTQTSNSTIRTEFPTLGLVSQTYQTARQTRKRPVSISATFRDSTGPARLLRNRSLPGSASPPLVPRIST